MIWLKAFPGRCSLLHWFEGVRVSSPRKILRLRASAVMSNPSVRDPVGTFAARDTWKKKKILYGSKVSRVGCAHHFWHHVFFLSRRSWKNTFFFLKNVFLFLGVEPSIIRRVSGMRRVAAGGALRAIWNASCFSKNAKIANRATIHDSAILGGSKGHVFGLGARCENKWA